MLPTSATNVLLFATSSGTPGSGPSQRPASPHLKFRFTVPGFDVIQHPATGPGRRGIALGIPSCFGGHEHGSAVGTMILAKVPNFTPECLWIVGSVYVGHSGATTNYSRREAFAFSNLTTATGTLQKKFDGIAGCAELLQQAHDDLPDDDLLVTSSIMDVGCANSSSAGLLTGCGNGRPDIVMPSRVNKSLPMMTWIPAGGSLISNLWVNVLLSHVNGRSMLPNLGV
ncbi:hypothetical protein BASA61_005725 [Batrachochytrium salamandrivorans]|nr:hypothetical protein BASA61_005725 [Batrachochytrium salamandrivorans]